MVVGPQIMVGINKAMGPCSQVDYMIVQRVPMRRFAHCVTLHPNNTSVFVAHVAPTAAIAVLRFNPNAANDSDDIFLTLTSWIKTGDVRHMFFHPHALT